MGLGSSKIPLSSVKGSKLMVRKPKGKHFLFSPRLCLSVLQQNPQRFCYEKDVEHLKQFIKSHDNLVSLKLRQDIELIRFVQLNKKKKPLSQQAEQHLSLILKYLQRPLCKKPRLVSSIVVPSLKNIENENALLKKRCNTSWFVMVKTFFLSMFKIKLSAKTLRKQPQSVQAVPGLDRAHRLSLFLAVELWKVIYGHEYVNKKQKLILKKTLSLDSNVYLTCKHTNRTLHVKYDNEIAYALKSSGPKLLSCGAKVRAKQIISVLGHLEKHSHSKKINHFCVQAKAMLSKIL